MPASMISCSLAGVISVLDSRITSPVSVLTISSSAIRAFELRRVDLDLVDVRLAQIASSAELVTFLPARTIASLRVLDVLFDPHPDEIAVARLPEP